MWMDRQLSLVTRPKAENGVRVKIWVQTIFFYPAAFGDVYLADFGDYGFWSEDFFSGGDKHLIVKTGEKRFRQFESPM